LLVTLFLAILWGELNKSEALQRFVLHGLFHLLQASGKPGLVSNKKALPFHGKAFNL
jgi:hypothetical protein